MGYDDRYGGDGRNQWRGRDSNQGREQARDRDSGHGRDRYDRDPGAHVDYYRGGERGQRRTGPEGGFEMREDYRRDDRHFSERGHGGSESSFSSGSGGVNQGMGAYGGYRGGRGGTDDAFGGSTGSGGGVGYDPNFAGGPRFDRQDIGRTGTHGVHPVSSPYGEDKGAGANYGVGGGSARAQAILDQAEQGRGGDWQSQGGQSRRQHDPHYAQWRQQQIAALDNDYQEYAQENATRFEQEFGSWREKRGQQRQSMGRVTEHMDVVGSDDSHVGTVDKVKDGRIILTRSDPNAGGHHHSIPCGWLESVDDKVRLNRTAEEAMKAWRDEETSRALFEDRDSGSDGPHILDRAFSGTYRDEK